MIKPNLFRALPLVMVLCCGFPQGSLAAPGELDGALAGLPRQAVKQDSKVRGVVVDALTREPIIGATVMVVGTSNGVTTNIDGEFAIDAPQGATLSIAYLGYKTQEVKVGSVKLLSIELSEATEELGEVVVTAFGVGQKKESMVGAVSQIRPDELKVPSSSLSSSFAGRLSGVIAVQRSGEPGADGANFWIRGKSTFSGATGALIILDGVEISSAELNALDPEVIEGFSILKDATATALYGTRGANGVMIVTTKSGKDLDKPIINFRLEGAVSGMTSVPEMADGVTYMQCYNEAVTRPTSSGTPYSEERIEATRLGLNPLVYPNVNWYDEMFKKNAFSQRANFNIRGGTKKMDYFMSVGVKHSDGNLRSLSKGYGFSYDNNIDVTNYDFVNNLNVQATPTTKLSLGLNASITDWKGPSSSASNLFALSMVSNPVDFPISWPAGVGGIDTEDIMWGDKSGGPYNTGYRNPIAEYVTGYKTSFTSILSANFKVEQKLDMLLKGLKFSGLFSFKNKSVSNAVRSSAYNAFELDSYNVEDNTYTLRRTAKEYDTAISTSGSSSGERNLYLQAMLDYKHTFNDVHDLNVMFLYNQQQYNVNNVTDLFSSLPKRKQGIAGRVSYVYDGRYMMEANFGYNGSENFAPNHRYGFFPSVALGYNISNEKFWDKFRSVISNLKLRASWGLVGNDDTGSTAGRFAYLEDITLTGGPNYKTGIGSKVSYSGPKWTRYYNANMGWEVGEKWNVGIDMQLYNALNFTIEAFRETRRDIFLSRENTIPQFLGTAGAKVYANLGKMKNEGLEMSLDYSKQISKDCSVSFKSTFTYAHNTVLERDEPPFREYPNLSSVGHSVDQYLLYIAHGLFPDEQSIKNNPTQMLGYTPQPGDIWYANIPNYKGETDNIIDSNDRMYVGNPQNPEIIYGFGPSVKWKKWDFSFFFQGAAKSSILMSGIDPFGTVTIKGLFKYIADDHWSLDNPNPNASYPRLTREDNANNFAASTFWLRNGAFLKLKNAEIGYTLKNCRFYVSGQNLLTFSPFDYWDPEMGSGNGLKYPTQRVINFGVQVTFNNK